MYLRISLPLALAFVLSACANNNKLIGREGLQVVDAKELPAPALKDLVLEQRPYIIGPFDRVAIDVYGVSELARTVQVDANGQIAMPLVGVVQAAGQTPMQLAGLIADKLRGRYVRDPHVTVNTDTVNQMLTVDGQVTEPGLYPVTGRMTLMRAVARAKGLTEFAQDNFVVVFRRVNGQQMAALYDLRAIRQGLYDDPEVFANDVVLVGESRGRRIFQSIIQGSALLTAPIIALSQ